MQSESSVTVAEMAAGSLAAVRVFERLRIDYCCGGKRPLADVCREKGLVPTRWTGGAAADPLFAGFSEPETVFHWHGETFNLPDGAEWLAWSDRCRHQAFRFGSNVYRLQFHLEVTPDMIRDWIRQPANSRDVNSLSVPIEPLEGGERLLEVGRSCSITGAR